MRTGRQDVVARVGVVIVRRRCASSAEDRVEGVW